MFRTLIVLIICFLITGCSGWRYKTRIVSADRNKEERKAIDPYVKKLMKEIAKQWTLAIPSNNEYTGEIASRTKVTLKLIIRSNGYIENIEVIYPKLDEKNEKVEDNAMQVMMNVAPGWEEEIIDASIQAVKNAEPFRPFPQGVPDEYLTIYYDFYCYNRP